MIMWTPFLPVLLIFGMTQHADGLSSLGGCLSGKQAQSMSEEILRLFEEVPLVESLTALTSNITPETFSHLDSCFKLQVYLDAVKAVLAAAGQDIAPDVTKLFEQKRLKQVRSFVDSYKSIITPLIGFAEQVETKIKEGNQRRQILVDSTTKFKGVWQTIRLIHREQQATVQAFDVFLKDSILQKSATIGQYVREGNANGRWTVTKVKDELAKEMDRAFKMLRIFGEANHMVTMVREMAQNYVASQVYSALQKSKLEAAMLKDSVSWRFERFSEVTISESLRKAAKLMYDSMVVGMEQAETYHTQVNQTVNSVSEGMKKIESTPISSNCQTTLMVIRIAASLLLHYGTIQITVGPLKTATDYRKEIEAFSTGTILPTLDDVSLKSALLPILQSVHFDEATATKLGGAVDYLREFAREPHGLDMIQTNRTLAEVSEYMKQLLGAFQCQKKRVQLVGRIIQGCIDGRDNFKRLYTTESNRLRPVLTKCSETWAIDIPSKSEVQNQVQYASTPNMFDFQFPNCKQNQHDSGYVYYDDLDDDDSVKRLSSSQRMMVCDLKKRGKTQSRIAHLIKMDEGLIRGVRCKQ